MSHHSDHLLCVEVGNALSEVKGEMELSGLQKHERWWHLIFLFFFFFYRWEKWLHMEPTRCDIKSLCNTFLWTLVICMENWYQHSFQIFEALCECMGFPGGSVVKNLPAMQETQEMWVQSLGWEDPLEKGITTHSSILAWRISWTEETVGLCGVTKSPTGLSN